MSTFQAPAAPQAAEDERKQRVLDQFNSFPFSSDEVFQQGLSGILGHESTNDMSEIERSELIMRTQVFYFNRTTGHELNLEDVQTRYTADLIGTPSQTGDELNETSSGAEHGEMRTLTFLELKSLIEQGKTDNIPNNRYIPDTLNAGAPSESSVPVRKKPWEGASHTADACYSALNRLAR